MCPSSFSLHVQVKTEPLSFKSSGGSSDRSTATKPPSCKIKKEEDA